MPRSAPTDAVQELVEAEAPHVKMNDDGMVVCTINGHTMPARLDVVQSFVRGKKYAKLKEEAGGKALVAKYDPILAPSVNFPDKLFCAVSNLLIDTNASAIEKHMSGRRFKAAMERVSEGKQEMFMEPDFAREEDEVDGEEEEDEEALMDQELDAEEVDDDGLSDSDVPEEEDDESEGEVAASPSPGKRKALPADLPGDKGKSPKRS